MNKPTLLALCCSLALAACGGGGGSSQPTVQAQDTTGGKPSAGNANAATSGNSTGSTAQNGGNTAAPVTANVSEALKQVLPVGRNAKRPQNFGQGSTRTDAEGMTITEFSGSVLSIDNAKGTAKAVTTADAGFDEFTINGTKVLLLASRSDAGKAVALRKLTANDFPDPEPADKSQPVTFGKNFKPKDPENPGWVGSLGDDPRGGAFARVRFGAYVDADNVSHLFVHGNPANRARTSGKAEYAGSAVFGKDGRYEGLANALTASADFDKKEIDFALKVKEGDTLNFGGKISGNVFSGTKNGVETRGGFFGSQDIGGMLNVLEGQHQGRNGAFGATMK